MPRSTTNLLFANDQEGEHPASWYASSTAVPPVRPALAGRHRVEVAVIGGGYTGLSAALHLAQRGRHVAVLEAHRVGWGASGRNGGQMSGGQRLEVDELEQRFGDDRAQRLHQLGERAKRLVLELIRHHRIECELTPGLLFAEYRPQAVAELPALVDRLAQRYGRTDLQLLDAAACKAHVASPIYGGGVFDPDGWHLQPLAFALGVAEAALAAGAELFEATRVEALKRAPSGWRLEMAGGGEVVAEHVVLAINGYQSGLVPTVEAWVMPINNFMVATEPLGEALATELLPSNAAIDDAHFIVRYYRRTSDHRVLFGGGETYRYRFPTDIRGLVRPALEQTLPQLRGVDLTHAWGGTLAITRSRLPHLDRPEPGLWVAGGYSGHGVAMATFAGHLMAAAILGDEADFEAMRGVAGPPFPGGRHLRGPLLAGGMAWYAWRDRLGW